MLYEKIAIADMCREDWLKLRKTGIGGSEAGAVCGLNPYSSPMNVFRDKTCETIEDAGLECKTVNAYNADKWKDGEIPLHYMIQCYHYMRVTGKKVWYIAAVILGKDFVYRRLEWNDEIIAHLIQAEKEFWGNYILTGIMPKPENGLQSRMSERPVIRKNKKDRHQILLKELVLISVWAENCTLPLLYGFLQGKQLLRRIRMADIVSKIIFPFRKLITMTNGK